MIFSGHTGFMLEGCRGSTQDGRAYGQWRTQLSDRQRPHPPLFGRARTNPRRTMPVFISSFRRFALGFRCFSHLRPTAQTPVARRSKEVRRRGTGSSRGDSDRRGNRPLSGVVVQCLICGFSARFEMPSPAASPSSSCRNSQTWPAWRSPRCPSPARSFFSSASRTAIALSHGALLVDMLYARCRDAPPPS